MEFLNILKTFYTLMFDKTKELIVFSIADQKKKKKKINIHILIIRVAAMFTFQYKPVCTSLSSLLFILLFHDFTLTSTSTINVMRIWRVW